MISLYLTDTYGDPVVLNWEHVTLIEEVRHEHRDDEGKAYRKFEKTKIWFVGGAPSYAQVKESVPQIMEQVDAKVAFNWLAGVRQ